MNENGFSGETDFCAISTKNRNQYSEINPLAGFWKITLYTIKKFFLLSIVAIVLLARFFSKSHTEPPYPAQELYANFQPVAPSDTLLVGLDSVAGEHSREIPARLLLAIDSALIAEMLYEPDTFDFRNGLTGNYSLDEKFWSLPDRHTTGLVSFQVFADLLQTRRKFCTDTGGVPLRRWRRPDLMRKPGLWPCGTVPVIVTGYQEHHIRWNETNPDEPEAIDLKKRIPQAMGSGWISGNRFRIPASGSNGSHALWLGHGCKCCCWKDVEQQAVLILRQPLQIHFRLLPRRLLFKIGIDFRPFVEETAFLRKKAVLHPASVIQAVAFAGGSVGSEVGTS